MNQPACTPITLFSTWFQVVTQSFVTNAGKGWQTFTTHSTTTTTQTLCTISDAGTCGGFLTTTITSDVYGSSTFGPITISGTTTYESAVSTPTSTITCPATTDAAPSNTEDAVSDTASSVGPSVATVKPKQEQSTTGAVIAPAVAGGIVACILLALLLFFTRRTWSRKRSVTSSSETTFFDQSLRGPMDKAPSEWTPSSGSPDEWLPIAQSPWISRRLSLQTSIDSVMAQHAVSIRLRNVTHPLSVCPCSSIFKPSSLFHLVDPTSFQRHSFASLSLPHSRFCLGLFTT